jgi:hypothetical protein
MEQQEQLLECVYSNVQDSNHELKGQLTGRLLAEFSIPQHMKHIEAQLKFQAKETWE